MIQTADLAAANGGKQLHGGQPGVCASRSVPRSGPAAADRLAQNPCVPPASSPARRLRGRPWRWVDRSAKRAASAAAILPAGQMDVDDGVTFVAAAGGLIDSHGVEGDRPRGDELAIESRHLIGRQTAKAATLATSQPRAAASACGPSRKPSTQAPASAGGVKQPANNPPSLPGASARWRSAISQVAVRRGSIATIRNRGLSRFACASRWNSTGCARGGVRADQHHQIAVFHIIVAAGHHVGAKGPLVASDR